MSRKQKGPAHRQITVYLEPEDVYALDNFQTSFGIDSRSGAALCLFRAGYSALPVDTALNEIAQLTVRETRKAEFQALADHYQLRSNMFRSSS